jgi:N-acetylneuraminic acid mutarotase
MVYNGRHRSRDGVVRLLSIIALALLPGCDFGAVPTVPEATATQDPELRADVRLGSLAWRTLADMPIAVRAAAAASDGSYIYVLGGNLSLGNEWTTLTQIYDPSADTWRIGASFSDRRDSGMAASLSDGIHLIGGRDQERKTDHQVYDPVADTWRYLAPLPFAVNAAAMEVFRNRIYVIGGLDEANQPISTVLIYDRVRDEWTTGAPMPTPRFHGAHAAHRGRIFVAGGQLPGRTTTNVLEVYFPGRDEWQALAPLPFPREALGGGEVMRGGMVGNRFCVFGGRVGQPGNPPQSQTYCYDPPSDSWARGPDMLTPRLEMAFADHAGKVYAIGGRTSDEFAVPVTEVLETARLTGRR